MRALSVSIPTATAVLLAATAPAALAAGTTERVSVSSGGQQANGSSDHLAISLDGRSVALDSIATNLVADDTNGVADVFVRERLRGTIERVSVSWLGEQGNGASFLPATMGSGRFVAFNSDATNLVADDTNGATDVFLRDHLGLTTVRVSIGQGGVEGNGGSTIGAISPNGSVVSFSSQASNLVAGDTNGAEDVFVRDLRAHTTARIDVGPGGEECDKGGFGGPVSGGGQFVAFRSACTNLVPGGTNGQMQAFIHDRSTGQNELVSVSSKGLQGDGYSSPTAISPDGRYVALVSYATNLVPGDTNGAADVFVRDRATGKTKRVSVSSQDKQGNGDSLGGKMSADGRLVTFSSAATNLVMGDTNGTSDIFVRDLATEKTERVSVSSSGLQSNDGGNGGSVYEDISADGTIVVFESDATNLVPTDTNGADDIFVHTR